MASADEMPVGDFGPNYPLVQADTSPVDSYLIRSSYMIVRKRYADAITFLEKGLKQFPEDADLKSALVKAHIRFGDSLCNQQNNRAAAEQYQAALERDKNNAEVREKLSKLEKLKQ